MYLQSCLEISLGKCVSPEGDSAFTVVVHRPQSDLTQFYPQLAVSQLLSQPLGISSDEPNRKRPERRSHNVLTILECACSEIGIAPSQTVFHIHIFRLIPRRCTALDAQFEIFRDTPADREQRHGFFTLNRQRVREVNLP